MKDDQKEVVANSQALKLAQSWARGVSQQDLITETDGSKASEGSRPSSLPGAGLGFKAKSHKGLQRLKGVEKKFSRRLTGAAFPGVGKAENQNAAKAASIPLQGSKDEPSEEDEEDGRGRAFQKRTEKVNVPLAKPAHGKKKKKHA